MNMAPVRTGDVEAFEDFALAVHSLVGMLRSLEGEHGFELRCGSHVDRLISKLSPSYRDGFIEHCINQGLLNANSNQTYTLHHLPAWLQAKSRAKRMADRAAVLYKCDGQGSERKEQRSLSFKGKESRASVFHNSELPMAGTRTQPLHNVSSKPSPSPIFLIVTPVIITSVHVRNSRSFPQTILSSG